MCEEAAKANKINFFEIEELDEILLSKEIKLKHFEPNLTKGNNSPAKLV